MSDEIRVGADSLNLPEPSEAGLTPPAPRPAEPAGSPNAIKGVLDQLKEMRERFDELEAMVSKQVGAAQLPPSSVAQPIQQPPSYPQPPQRAQAASPPSPPAAAPRVEEFLPPAQPTPPPRPLADPVSAILEGALRPPSASDTLFAEPEPKAPEGGRQLRAPAGSGSFQPGPPVSPVSSPPTPPAEPAPAPVVSRGLPPIPLDQPPTPPAERTPTRPAPVSVPEQPQGLQPRDLLVEVAGLSGPARAAQLQQELTLTRMREASREQLSTRKGGRPEFLRITTKFERGNPMVIAVTSPKGGVTKSTTAANLAAYLAKAAEISNLGGQIRVLLVDGDVANGNLALRVASTMEPNMLDLLDHMDGLRGAGADISDYRQDMAPFVLPNEALDNLDILAAPDNPDIIDQIYPSDLEYLIESFSQFYDVVIFDTGTQITEHTNCAWLDFAKHGVYLMVEPEIACLQSTTEYARRARLLNLITAEQCRVVMIRANVPIANLKPRQVLAEVFSFIPPDRAFLIHDHYLDAVEASNAGEFLVLKSAEYAAELTPIVKQMLEGYERQTHHR